MARLNEKAGRILWDEVERCTRDGGVAGEVQRELIKKRLDKLRAQSGTAATKEELQQLISDLLPNFSQKVLQKSARANRPLGQAGKLALTAAISTASLLGLGGLLWLVNLPYPMIRRPVAEIAPLLLLPSYLSMDRNYREAVANVEQAEQLINQATSFADLELGATKAQAAQKNLDGLPVWFLGYEPTFYCRYFSCSWRFTFDEYQAARQSVGRLGAKVFQEKNAIAQFQQGETALQQAKQQYQAATGSQQEAAVAAWQAALDLMAQLPPETLASKLAAAKLNAYQRDFQAVSGRLAGNWQTDTFIAAAQQFALAAVQMGQNPPHPASQWQQCERLWQEAIARLQDISPALPGYGEAQKLLAEYSKNLSQIQIRRQAEAESVEALAAAQDSIERLLASLPETGEAGNRYATIAQLQAIINRLRQVQSGTTAYPEAQQLLQSVRQKIQQFKDE